MTRIGNLIRDPVELKQRAAELDKLSTMTERITKEDIRAAAQALRDCADDIAYLLSGQHKPVGCPCRLIENDNNGTCYLIYEDACFHHKHLKAREEQLKTSYEKAELQLKSTVRLQLVSAALTGCAGIDQYPKDLVNKAFAIANTVINELTK